MTVKVTKPALNLREELSSLKKPSGVAGEAMLRAETPQEQFNLIGAGRKNLIINGGFDVWQRGTSFNSIASSYCADRWYYVRSHTVDVDRVSCDLDGFKYATRITNVTSGMPTLYQFVENTGQFYVGQKLTLSFWVRASESHNVRSGRSWNGSTYVTNYHEHDLSTSWEYKQFTITINSNWAGSEDYFGPQIVASSGNTMSAGSWIEITGVQLELGSVATPFEHRSYGEELALCQRYYCKSYSDDTYPPTNTANGCEVLYSDGTTSYHGGYRFPVSMRVQPSISLWTKNGNANQAQLNFTSGSYVDISVYAPSHKSFNVYQSTAGTVGIYAFHYTADAEL